jgi:hypothetical protein
MKAKLIRQEAMFGLGSVNLAGQGSLFLSFWDITAGDLAKARPFTWKNFKLKRLSYYNNGPTLFKPQIIPSVPSPADGATLSHVRVQNGVQPIKSSANGVS